ncbi:acetyltransferase [Enterococcus florum]|uniref:Acetyltransferase n=1 Tax=Enterococcus florum TaxID=2480627 RepID=A0A4P5P769_9ENTE|nr:GNAT family N-acetyltransferase [Enterococcus florum]GCF93797.1 acetyltransferase [Enterococcus florum]
MKTKRLLLRRFIEQDDADLFDYLSDERVVKYEPYPPQTREQCKERVHLYAQSPDFWAVCLTDTGKVIGTIYLAEREQFSMEVGYVFNYAYQHKGYATEALWNLLSLFFSEKGVHRIYAQCNPENSASWRLLERLGFTQEGRLRSNIFFNSTEEGLPIWQDTFVYGLLENELKVFE